MNRTFHYPDRLELGLYPTPLEPLRRLTLELEGPSLWVKRDDLSGLELTGNKARKLEFLLAEALQQNCKVVITSGGLQSNHCRATAAACAKLGLKCHLVLRSAQPDPPYDGNLLLDLLFGAKITYLPKIEFQERGREVLDSLMEQYTGRGEKPYFFPVGGSVPLGSWGYIRAMEEIVGQMASADIASAHIIAACGSGGTVTGLMLGKALLNAPVKIWAVPVCDDLAYWQKELRRQLAETIAFYSLDLDPNAISLNLLDGYVGQGYAIPYPEEMQVIAKAASQEGIVLDPVYTGKAFYAMLDQIQKGTFRNGETVIFLHTGGVFGNFPLREQFTFD
ncbi:MAG: D-cysteine desulfhydrase [Candidatus Sumerlaeia bacterium]